jgi:hypothetical protein
MHDFGVWRNTAREGVRFIFETVRQPELVDADGDTGAHP